MKKLLTYLTLLTVATAPSCSCKKETNAPTQTVTTVDSWDGSYRLTQSSCSLSSYRGTESGTLVITNNQIPPYGLSEYLYDPISLQINGNFATIPADPMSQSDQNAGGRNSWDFQQGSIKKNGNTLIIQYSFVIYYDNGTIKDRPVFNSTYTKQ